jgi:SAM-dependent methyltransferase
MDVRAHNRAAWDRDVERRNRWTVPVEPEAIERARAGEICIVLTPTKHVPRQWFPELHRARVLCLASGGGQQGPLLAAAGAKVAVLDNSPRQLAQDRLVAERENLSLETILGDMADLSVFADSLFDLIVHPVSNCFAPAVRPVWRECFRVLRAGGVLLAGFTNPVRYLFDNERTNRDRLEVRHAIPYSDLIDLDPADRQALVDGMESLEFGHTLEDQIGGQLEAGFVLTGFYEDYFGSDADDPLSRYLATFIATRAVKPEQPLPSPPRKREGT